MEFITAESYEKMSRKAANIIAAEVILNKSCVLGLATGSTPVGVYKRLIELYEQGDLDFSSVKTVNLDEYCGLSEKHIQSYRYFMNNELFDHVNINKDNTYVPNGLAEDLEAECIRYDRIIESLGGIDVQLLGIGRNGHIGFNEPKDSFDKGTHVITLQDSTRLANARFFGRIAAVPEKALTVGIRTIMSAKKVILIANGAEKKEIVEKAFYGPVTPMVPASILQMHPNLTVIYSEE